MTTERQQIAYAATYERQWLLYFVDEGGRGPHRSFPDWAALSAWVEERYGEVGWKRDGRTARYEPSTTHHDVPCDITTAVSEGRWTRFGRCTNRIKDGNEKCGLHLAHERKAAEREAASNARKQRSDAAQAIAQDAVAALASQGIEARAHYHTDSGYTGKVTVHAEDVLALLRKLAHAEEILGEELS